MTFLDDLRFINFTRVTFSAFSNYLSTSESNFTKKISLKIFEIEKINYPFFLKISLKMKNTRLNCDYRDHLETKR